MSVLAVPVAQAIIDLNAKVVALSPYDGAKLHLYSNDFTPDELTVLADFTEVVASGVVAQTCVWSAAFLDANDIATSTAGEKLYVQSGATGDTCFGCYLTNTAGTVLLASARLDDAPFNFTAIGDALPLTIKLTMPGGIAAETPIP